MGFIGSALGGGVALLEAEALGPLEADALTEGVVEGTLEEEGAVVAGVFGPPWPPPSGPHAPRTPTTTSVDPTRNDVDATREEKTEELRVEDRAERISLRLMYQKRPVVDRNVSLSFVSRRRVANMRTQLQRTS